MSRAIPAIDLMFLLTETPNSPKHVGALVVFDRPKRAGADLAGRIVRAYRAAPPVAPFNYVPELVGVTRPRWNIAQDVDLDYHVQHVVLPSKTSDDGLQRIVADLHESVLDRNRPLFRAWVFEGLPGGRVAMYLKIHHAIVDGMSAMARITASLSTDAKGGIPLPFYAVEFKGQSERAPRSAIQRLAQVNLNALRQTSALRDVSLGLVRKGISRLLKRPQSGSQPFTAANTPMNAPIRAPRALATLSLPLDGLKSAGKAFGGTINDVVVSIVDAGMHEYLQHIGHASKKRLVALCPISLRDSDDKSATTKASMMFVPLGQPSAQPAARLEQVMGALTTAKDEVRAMSKDAAMTYAMTAFGLGEVAMATRVGQVAGHLGNFFVSNVPGAREPLYIDGARLAAVYPISGLGAGVGLNVTVVSTADSLHFGFVANGQSLPQLPVLARRVGEAYAQLAAAAARVTPTDAAVRGNGATSKPGKVRGGVARKRPARPLTAAKRRASPARRAGSR